jgi:hypothetical protein
MPSSLQTVSRTAAAVLDALTEGLDVGGSRKVDRGTAFVPVCVEYLEQRSIGPLFSIAHYFEENGDLVPDPDVVFVRAAAGWAPISFQNLLAYRVALTFHEDGMVEVDAHEQRDLVHFCEQWMRNIAVQQGLPTRKA